MTTVRRVLVMTLDGLRPDVVTPEQMPFLSSLAARGTRLVDYHAAYPPHTRVQVSTLATGAYPGTHGIVANVMVVPGAGSDHIVDTSDYRHLESLDAVTGGRAVLVPTLSELLSRDGRRLAIAASSSPGSTILWTRTHPYRVVNPRTTYGRPDLVALREKLGEPPDPAGPQLALAEYAVRAALALFLEDPEVAVTVVWINEPDASLHRYGLGAPEVVATLRELDALMERTVVAMDERRLLDDTVVAVVSDHGHSTPRTGRSLAEGLRHAPAAVQEVAALLLPSSDFLFVRPGARRPRPSELRPLVEWLYEQPWTGVVFARPEDAADLPGVLPLDAVWGDSLRPEGLERLPVLAVSPAWSDEPNAHGVPGTVLALTEQVTTRSTHGAASPWDLHAFALFFGAGIRAGAESALPAGAVDLVPTVSTMLGLHVPEHAQGRVLWEVFDHPAEQPPTYRRELLRPFQPAGQRSPVAVRERVGSATYLHLAAPDGIG